MHLRLLKDVPVEPWRAALLRRALALFTLAMLAATWRLWTPQTVFPRVPLVYSARAFSPIAEWLVAGSMVGGLVAAAIANKRDWIWRAGLRVFACALTGMILLDQHRLQPWAYQALLVALALANCRPPRSFTLIRLLTASIYFYSGLSKLDYEFLHSLGQQLLATLMQFFGLDVASWPESGRLLAAALLPLAEIAIAVGLVFRRTRQAALIASLVLHAALLLVLGPWGLKHSLAVLLWNLSFIVQNVLLFAWPAVEGQSSPTNGLADQRGPLGVRPRWLTALLSAATHIVLVSAMLLPLGEPWGWFDAWPSWALYAPGSQRVTLLIPRSAVGELGRLERFAQFDPETSDAWVRLRIDRWSLDELGAPLCPQNRFQLGVAAALGAALHLDHRIRAVEIDRADRFAGQRSHRVLEGIAEISAAAGGFLWNGRPDGRLLLAHDPPPAEPGRAEPAEQQ